MMIDLDLGAKVEIVIIVAVVVKRGSIIVVKVKKGGDDEVEATAVVVVMRMTQGVIVAHHHPPTQAVGVDLNHERIEKGRSTRDIIRNEIVITKIRRGGGIIRMVSVIERRIKNAREGVVVVGNTHHVVMMMIVVVDRMTNIVMMTRQHLTPPPLFRTMNVRYYNNMNPNAHHPQQQGLAAVLLPHLANMA